MAQSRSAISVERFSDSRPTLIKSLMRLRGAIFSQGRGAVESVSASVIISVVERSSVRTFAKARRIWRSSRESDPPNSERSNSSSAGQSEVLKGSVRSEISAIRRSGLIAGLSAKAIELASTAVGIPDCAKARCSALTSAPGLRRITAILDQGRP